MKKVTLGMIVVMVTMLGYVNGIYAANGFITPISVTPLGNTGWYNNSNYPTNMINSSGLSVNTPAGTHDNDELASTMWFAAVGQGASGAAAVVTDQDLVFDLGGTYTLNGAFVWNMNQKHATAGDFFEDRGTSNFHAYVSSDSDPLTATWTSKGSRTLNMAGGTTAEPAQFVNLYALNVRLVKFEIESAYSGLANEYVGLSEVRFQDAHPGVIFSEDFEDTGVADGDYEIGWGTQFTVNDAYNILNPAATGASAAWLNPVPAALGDIFGTIYKGGTATADLPTVPFVANTVYTLTFTHFKRDDLVGDATTVRIADADTDSILASAVFPAVTTDDTFLTRTLTYITNAGDELGHAIRVQFYDHTEGTALQQAGIDNIMLTANAPRGTLISIQ